MMKSTFELHSKTSWFSSSNLMEKLNFRWKYQSEIFELSLKKQYRKGKYNKLKFSLTLYLECLILNSNYKWALLFISRKTKWVPRYVTTLLQFTALEVGSNTFFFSFLQSLAQINYSNTKYFSTYLIINKVRLTLQRNEFLMVRSMTWFAHIIYLTLLSKLLFNHICSISCQNNVHSTWPHFDLRVYNSIYSIENQPLKILCTFPRTSEFVSLRIHMK